MAVDGSNRGGGGVGTRPRYQICLPLPVPIGLSPLLILTLCGPERVLVVSGGEGGCERKEAGNHDTSRRNNQVQAPA